MGQHLSSIQFHNSKFSPPLSHYINGLRLWTPDGYTFIANIMHAPSCQSFTDTECPGEFRPLPFTPDTLRWAIDLRRFRSCSKLLLPLTVVAVSDRSGLPSILAASSVVISCQQKGEGQTLSLKGKVGWPSAKLTCNLKVILKIFQQSEKSSCCRSCSFLEAHCELFQSSYDCLDDQDTKCTCMTTQCYNKFWHSIKLKVKLDAEHG